MKKPEIKKKIILAKICEKKPDNIPEIYNMQNIVDFGLDYKLYDYQQKALSNILNCLYLYFNNKKKFYELYQNNGLDADFEKNLHITCADKSFDFYNRFYQKENSDIPFENFINRASFWMATGSGKTLVMIKLIQILFNLIQAGEIPKKNILILAPKENILSQIKKQIETFNKSYKLTIELKSLKNFAKTARQGDMFSGERVTIFYYRADNISDKNNVSVKKDAYKQRIDYENILNNGNWYLLLDEAHKGIKDASKRQQYYTALSKNGFLFNFSATFVELIDIVTTVYNFNLKEFIAAGYGKRLKIMNSEYKYFDKKNNKEFSEKEREKIVLKSLITLAAVKKEKKKIDDIKAGFYHNPMLVTIANRVNATDAELKIFFNKLVKIAKGDFKIEEAKESLADDFKENLTYHFDMEKISKNFLDIIEKITKGDILKHIFNTEKQGGIEYSTIAGNSKEIAFTHKNSSEPFALIYISEADKFKADLLNDYIESKTPYTESFFSRINDSTNPINILLGSRIFTEGWDSNRPNVINFINIGVNEEAKKFVLQATGRGVRIEPVKNFRKRFEKFKNHSEHVNNAKYEKILKTVQSIETLFIFATKKQVLKNIIEELDKEEIETWKKIKGIKPNKKAREKIFVYTVKNQKAAHLQYNIHESDYQNCLNFIGNKKNPKDKIILFNNTAHNKNIIKTLNKIRKKNNFKHNAKKINYPPQQTLFILNDYFNMPEKALVFEKFKPIEKEIKHFEKIEAKNIKDWQVRELEANIKAALQNNNLISEKNLKKTIQNLNDSLDKGELKGKEYREKWEKYSKQLQAVELLNEKSSNKYISNLKINTKFLNEHYYKPILFVENYYKEFFRYIIKKRSEIAFIKELERYYNKTKNNLKKCDWWYFSKIIENTDEINIPYHNSITQKPALFYPDFIFWLKKNNKYHIIFIDPKGAEHTRNAIDKIKGFKKFFKGELTYKNKNVIPGLWYFNEEKPAHDLKQDYQKYWTDDFKKIFNLDNAKNE